MTPQDEKLLKRLASGAIPVGLLFHILDTAETLEHGTVEIIFQAKGAPIDVVVKQRKRFDAQVP